MARILGLLQIKKIKKATTKTPRPTESMGASKPRAPQNPGTTRNPAPHRIQTQLRHSWNGRCAVYWILWGAGFRCVLTVLRILWGAGLSAIMLRAVEYVTSQTNLTSSHPASAGRWRGGFADSDAEIGRAEWCWRGRFANSYIFANFDFH